MNFQIKKFLFIFLAILLLPIFDVLAIEYTPIVGIPGLEGTQDFNGYINALYTLSISVAALIAVVKIVLAGAKYMLSGTISDKSSAKEDIRNSLIGLLIIIGAVTILSTINSDLTNFTIFDESDRITVNDRYIPTEEMQEHCDAIEARGGDCGEILCDEDSASEAEWDRLQPIIDSSCSNPSCADRCEAIGGVMRGQGWFGDGAQKCDRVDKNIIEGWIQDFHQQQAVLNCPAGETCVGMGCMYSNGDDSGYAAGSICKEGEAYYDDYQTNCAAECEMRGEDSIYLPETRTCVIKESDAVTVDNLQFATDRLEAPLDEDIIGELLQLYIDLDSLEATDIKSSVQVDGRKIIADVGDSPELYHQETSRIADALLSSCQGMGGSRVLRISNFQYSGTGASASFYCI